MKLLPTVTSILLAALVGPVTAMIVERDIQQDVHGNWWTTRACPKGDCAYLAPLIPRDKKDKENSKKRALEINRVREEVAAEGPAFEEPKATPDPNKLVIDSSRALDIVVSGWDASFDMEFVLVNEEASYEIRYPIADAGPFMVDEEEGVATAKIKPTGGDGIYTQYLEYTENGQEKTLNGGSFKYEHRGEIVRRSGGARTTVGEAAYEGGGQVMEAVGRIYFSSFGVDYACTGTAIRDNKSGRSLVFTAAHCVWDDIDEVFGTDVIFVPNRDAVTGDTVLEGNMTLADIHRQCADDICGCWTLSGGVVHEQWPDTPWPERLEYDYGFYVVNDVGSHEGTSCGSDALDKAVDVLDFKVGVPVEGEFVHNFGYSLDFNPDFRYCAETVGVNQPTFGLDTGWMDSCGLTGGSSGGPWIKDFDPATGSGIVVSVNSWSYADSPGNGGPFIDESAARCLVNAARAADMEWMMAQPEGEQGIYASCYDRPCVWEGEEVSGRKLRGGRRKLCGSNKEEATA